MTNICPMYNSGHLRVCTVKRSSTHARQICGLNNKTAQLSKPLQERRKVSHLECRCFCSYLEFTLSSTDRSFTHLQYIIYQLASKCSQRVTLDSRCDIQLVNTASIQVSGIPLAGIPSKAQGFLARPLGSQSNHWTTRG